MKAHILRDYVLKTAKKGKQKIVVNYEQGSQKRIKKLRKTAFSYENSRFLMVGVSLKDLAKPSKINGLQAASKVLLFRDRL